MTHEAHVRAKQIEADIKYHIDQIRDLRNFISDCTKGKIGFVRIKGNYTNVEIRLKAMQSYIDTEVQYRKHEILKLRREFNRL